MANPLPTAWMRGLRCARVHSPPHRPGSVWVRLPAQLVPARRFARLSVARALGGLLLSVRHEEPWTRPMPGRHAWQREYREEPWSDGVRIIGASSEYRELGVRAGRVEGRPEDVGSLRTLLSRAAAEDVLVRATGEGFDLWLPLPSSGTRPCSNSPTDAEVASLATALAVHPSHGAWLPGRGTAPTGLEAVRDRLKAYRHEHGPDAAHHLIQPFTPTGRLADVHPSNYPLILERIDQETKDMKKSTIDATQAQDLPFGLIAGEAIVQCEFSDGAAKDYAYFAGGLSLSAGDYVVVASPYGDGGSVFDEESGGYLKVVRVTSTDTNAKGVRRAAKWIIGKVDVAEYRDRRRRIEELRLLDEQIAVAKREAMKALELKQLMDLSPVLAALVAKRFEVAGVPLEAPEASKA